MDLTPERKQQIEEEEKRRLAEERYRAQVRANLNANSVPSRSPSTHREPKPEQRKSRVWLLLAILAIVIVWAIINRSSTDAPVSQKIASGQIVVRAKGYVQYRFQVLPYMGNAHVNGRFNTLGGTGNDIEAIITAEDEFSNWINGHQARAFYSTQGKKTADSFDVRLAPGTYYLAFNNRFSAFSSKNVSLEVNLNYQRQ